jgi:hypothetical protein
MDLYLRHGCIALLFTLAATSSGCAFVELPSLLKENTRTVKASTDGIAANTREVEQSSRITRQLLPAMQGLGALEQPMRDVAGLAPAMTRVAALDVPMKELSNLGPGMTALSRLDDPMIRLAQMRTSLDAVAALDRSMRDVAALRSELRAVAQLQASMAQLGTLREPMVRVAELRQPMAQLASLAPLGNPFGVAGIFILALAAWGVVTFAAVRLAIGNALGARPR